MLEKYKRAKTPAASAAGCPPPRRGTDKKGNQEAGGLPRPKYPGTEGTEQWPATGTCSRDPSEEKEEAEEQERRREGERRGRTARPVQEEAHPKGTDNKLPSQDAKIRAPHLKPERTNMHAKSHKTDAHSSTSRGTVTKTCKEARGTSFA